MKNITHFAADFSQEEASLVRYSMFFILSTHHVSVIIFLCNLRLCCSAQNACLITSGGSIVSGGDDGVVRIWAVDNGETESEAWKVSKVFELKDHKGAVSALSEHPIENWICSAGKDGACKLWDLASGKLVSDIPCMVDGLAGVGSVNGKPPKIECRGCVFSIDGQFLYTIQSPRKGGAYLIR